MPAYKPAGAPSAFSLERRPSRGSACFSSLHTGLAASLRALSEPAHSRLLSEVHFHLAGFCSSFRHHLPPGSPPGLSPFRPVRCPSPSTHPMCFLYHSFDDHPKRNIITRVYREKCWAAPPLFRVQGSRGALEPGKDPLDQKSEQGLALAPSPVDCVTFCAAESEMLPWHLSCREDDNEQGDGRALLKG